MVHPSRPLQELAPRVSNSLRPKKNGSEMVLLIRSPRDNPQPGNWQDVAHCLSAIYPDLDVVIPGVIPFAEQVRRLSSAGIVVATQGAHAINLLLASRLMSDWDNLSLPLGSPSPVRNCSSLTFMSTWKR